MWSSSFFVFNRFPLSRRAVSGHAATPILLLSLKKRRPRQPSLHRRIVRTISPVAYTFNLPTVGRRRTSPVMTWDRFLQAATCITLDGSPAITAWLPERRSSGATSSASCRGRWLAHHEGRNAVSRSLSAWLLRRHPFSGPPGGVTLAAYPRRNRGVRAESSVQVRTRTGRLQRFICPPFLACPFVPR